MNPLVTIIIPVFNRQALIKIALNSVKEQTYTLWECIVVDDGSSDDTIGVLESFSKKDARITYYKRERVPKGAPTCRNIGLEYANGDFVIFLDSDDYLLPFCLERRVATFHKNEDCDFLVFPMRIQKDKAILRGKIPDYEDYLLPFLSANLPWQTMCPIWKTSFLRKIGGFTEGYPRFNDPELMIRALLRSEVQFLVFNKMDCDCVFLPSLKHTREFSVKTYKSLKLFIPDMTKQLDASGKSFLKMHLALYLHLWFKYIYTPSGERDIWKSLNLIWMFKKENVITFSKSLSLTLRLLLFALSGSLLNKPINKLTDKSIY